MELSTNSSTVSLASGSVLATSIGGAAGGATAAGAEGAEEGDATGIPLLGAGAIAGAGPAAGGFGVPQPVVTREGTKPKIGVRIINVQRADMWFPLKVKIHAWYSSRHRLATTRVCSRP